MATRSTNPNVSDVGLSVLSAANLGVRINEWVDDIEEMRSKSKNLQGKVSGLMKIKFTRIKEAVISLVMKAEATGDPIFLRMRNKELDVKLKTVEKENIKLKDNIKRMKQTKLAEHKKAENITVIPDVECYLQEYTNEGNKGKTRVLSQEKIRSGGIERREIKEVERVIRPPFKGVSNPIPTPRATDMEDQEVIINRQIEALVATRKELRKVRGTKEK